jgi:hypothetical protein
MRFVNRNCCESTPASSRSVFGGQPHEYRWPISTSPVKKPVVWVRSEPGTTRFYVGLGRLATNKWVGLGQKLDTVG